MSGKFWYSVEEIAQQLDVTRQTVHWWRRRGVGPPYYKINGRVRYRKSDFDTWLAQQRSA